MRTKTMKTYIKPDTHIVEMESMTLLAGSGKKSLSDDGMMGSITKGGDGEAPASMSRVMRCDFGCSWDDSSDDIAEDNAEY